MVKITAETAADAPAREALLHASFGPGRFRKTAETLRRGLAPAEGLAFAAADTAGRLIGTLRFWNILAGTAGEALLLGPIAIEPASRCQGLGSSLILHGIEAARQYGHRSILLVGDEPYYRRFGFTTGPVENLHLPGPVERARFLGLELKPNALAGAQGLVVASGKPISQPAALKAASWRR